MSGKREGCTALIVYEPLSQTFIEPRSTPPEARGNGADEAEAVSDEYLHGQFGL